jgi:hypothetical protein
MYKRVIKKENFIIDNTNPINNSTVQIELENPKDLITTYNNNFKFDDLFNKVVTDNTYYNYMMFQNNNINTNVTQNFNDMQDASVNLTSVINTFNNNNVVELNNRLNLANITYTWSIENTIEKIKINYTNLTNKLNVSMPDYIKNNTTYNYITNLQKLNNAKSALSYYSDIANTIILGFDNINTSNMVSSDNSIKLEYIKNRLNNFGDLLGIGETYNTIKNLATFNPTLPPNKYEFLKNYSNYTISNKSSDFDKYYQLTFIPSVASEFVTLYSNVIVNYNNIQILMKNTYIQYAYDYVTNEISASITTITNIDIDYKNKKKIYETNFEEYKKSSKYSNDANNNYNKNKEDLNDSYLSTVTTVINEQQDDLKTKLKGALKQQWELDDDAANKAVTKNVISATQSLKNQIQASNELSNLINKQQSMLYDDAYSKDQLNKFNDSQSQFLSLDSYRTGIMHRYQDPSCNDENSYIYCEGGEIECQDIFGNKIPDKMITIETDYQYGNTYAKCGSILSQPELKDVTIDMSGIIMSGNIGFYYDDSQSKCPIDTPWAVGGDGYVVSFDSCYKTEEEASMRLSMMRNYNTTDLTNDAVVYIDGDYLVNEYMVNNPASKGVIYNQKTMWMNNKRHFKGIIDKLDTNNLFNVYIPDKNGVLFKGIPGYYLNTLDTNYIANRNKYLSNMKAGDLPRPVCKGGKFTTKCNVKPPYNPKTGEPYEIDPNNTEQKQVDKINDKGEKITTQLNTFNTINNDEYLPSSLNSTVGYSSY